MYAYIFLHLNMVLFVLLSINYDLISKEEYKGFLKGNIIKYVVRCDYKGNPVDDLTKATNYLTLLREQIATETIEEDNND